MPRGKTWGVVLIGVVIVVAAGVLVAQPFDTGEYEWTTVTIEAEDGSELASVDARIADTRDKRYVGLSETESLPDGEGMLFVHEGTGTYTYVMRNMSFPLDIIFVAEDGTITRIHHAPVPEEIEGGDGRFPGPGKYVLEVPRGWTNETGVGVGDRVVVPEGVTVNATSAETGT